MLTNAHLEGAHTVEPAYASVNIIDWDLSPMNERVRIHVIVYDRV